MHSLNLAAKWQPSWYACPINRFMYLSVETRCGSIVEFIPFGTEITPYHVTQLLGKMRLRLVTEGHRPA